MGNGLRSFLAAAAVLLLAVPPRPGPARAEEKFEVTSASIVDLLKVAGEGSPQPQDLQQAYDLMRYGGLALRATYCSTTPAEDVAYPKLNSAAPLYGRITLAAIQPSPTPAKSFHFVLDQSAALKEKEGDQAKPSLLEDLAQAVAGKEATTDKAREYDVLYCDLNGDLDLTNDAPVSLMKKQPPNFLALLGTSADVRYFDLIELKPGGQSAPDAPPLRLLPWYRTAGRQRAQFGVISADVEKATIEVAKQPYDVVLPSRLASGSSYALLRPAAPAGERPVRWQRIVLGKLQQAGDEFFTVTLTPAGDKLTVAPYEGKMGWFEVRAKDPDVKNMGAVGTFQSEGGAAMTMGEPQYRYTADRPARCRLPEGDYAIGYLTVDYGKLVVSLSANRYKLEQTPAPQVKPPAYGIKIREAAPVVLDFSGKPAVHFLLPGKGQTYRPGDQVRVVAIMVDPALDVMIRDLEDPSSVLGERTVMNERGEPQKVPLYASVNPTVTITNAAGESIAGGDMPFG